MGLHGVPQFVDALDGGVGGSVETDAVIGAADVIVNSTGNADHIDSVFAERPGAPEGAVAADGDDAVKAQELAGGRRPLLTLLRHEFLASGGIQNGAAPVDGMGNAFLIQPDNVAGDQTVPAPADTEALYTVVDGGTNHRTDTGVHTGGVAAAGKYADSFDTHGNDLPHSIFESLNNIFILPNLPSKVKRFYKKITVPGLNDSLNKKPSGE